MNTIQLLDRPIAFHRCLVDLTGSVTGALMLSQAIYWHHRMGGGWWYKTAEDWAEETGMGRHEFELAKKKCSEYLEMENRGLPRRTHYRVKVDAILSALQAVAPETGKPVCRKPADCNAGNRHATTSETTTETTTQTVGCQFVNQEAAQPKPPKLAEVQELPIPGLPPSRSERDFSSEAIVVLEYLNEKAGTRYRKSKSSLEPITARLKEDGVDVDACKAVIDSKVFDFKVAKPDMAIHLNPTTLFGVVDNFNKYLGSANVPRVLPRGHEIAKLRAEFVKLRDEMYASDFTTGCHPKSDAMNAGLQFARYTARDLPEVQAEHAARKKRHDELLERLFELGVEEEPWSLS